MKGDLCVDGKYIRVLKGDFLIFLERNEAYKTIFPFPVCNWVIFLILRLGWVILHPHDEFLRLYLIELLELDGG